MLDWLETSLAQTRQAWRIVYLHHTPFPTAAHRDDEICAGVLERIAPILERHQVHLVLAGHEHLYQRTLPRRGGRFFNGPGTVYITTGGGGSRVYDAGTDHFIARAAGVPHFLRVGIDGTSLRVEAVSRTGGILDRFTLESTPVIEGVTDIVGQQCNPRGWLGEDPRVEPLPVGRAG